MSVPTYPLETARDRGLAGMERPAGGAAGPPPAALEPHPTPARTPRRLGPCPAVPASRAKKSNSNKGPTVTSYGLRTRGSRGSSQEPTRTRKRAARKPLTGALGSGTCTADRRNRAARRTRTLHPAAAPPNTIYKLLKGGQVIPLCNDCLENYRE